MKNNEINLAMADWSRDDVSDYELAHIEEPTTYKINFSTMLKKDGFTEKQSSVMIAFHDVKVQKNIENGGTSFPSFLL